MRPIQRLEIIIDTLHARTVTEILDRHGVSGWSLLDVVEGRGERGLRRDDDLSGSSSNQLVLSTASPEQLEALLDELRPLLQRFGGVCMVSEAMWLRHRAPPVE